MLAAWARLSLSLDNIPSISDPLVIDAKLHLTLAVAYAEAYDKVWHSIYWNDATPATKRLISEKLNRLAYDAYTSVLDAHENMILYAKQEGLVEVPPAWVNSYGYLLLAKEDLEKEHPHQINSIQLKLL